MKKLFNLKNLLYAIVFFLPIYLLRVSIFGFPTNALEIFIGITFVIWIFFGQKKYLREFLSQKWLIFLGLLFFGLCTSFFVNGFSAVGLGIIKGWFILPIVFLLMAYCELEEDDLMGIYQSLFFSSLVVSLVSLGYYFLGHITFDGRLQAFYNSPNYLAMYLVPGFLGGIILAGKLRKYAWLMLLPIGASLYLTHSYAALIAVLAVTAGMSIWKNNFRWWLMGLIFVAALMIIFQPKSSKLQDILVGSPRSSLASRVMIWRSAGKIIQDNFVFGIGVGNFQAKYLEYQKFYLPYLEWAVPHPHNLFLAFWLSSGLTGLLAFLGLIIFWFWKVLQLKKTPAVLMAMGIMTYILLHGLVDTPYFKNDLAIIFWMNFLVLKKKIIYIFSL